MTQYFKEQLYSYYHQSFFIDKLLVSKKSNFQQIDIIENSFYGQALFLDNILQTTQRDEFFYHEMFVHIPMFSHINPKRVLIIGGGDGGILREVVKHNIEKAIMVEIDKDVIDLCATFMPSINNNAFKSPKAEVLVCDGVEYVKNTLEKFDVILIDSTDPISVGEGLFTKDFYLNVKKCLNKDGILVVQGGVPFYQKEEMLGINNKLKDIFVKSTFFSVSVPSYVGGVMVLSFSSDSLSNFNLPTDALSNKLALSKIDDLKYYNEFIHNASFVLPQYIKCILK